MPGRDTVLTAERKTKPVFTKEAAMQKTYHRDFSWPGCHGGGPMPPTQCPARAAPEAAGAPLLRTLAP